MGNQDPEQFASLARTIHDRECVIDTHCDTTQRMMDPAWDFSARHDDGHVDIPRLREGGIDAVFMAIFTAGPLPPGEGTVIARDQLDVLRSLPDRYPDDIMLAGTSRDILTAREIGKIAIIPAIEGGYLIDGCLDTLQEFYDKGVRYMTLTHGFHTQWADSSGIFERLEPLHHGLSDFGKDVVRAMQSMGMMVDVSHVSDETVKDVLSVATAPIIASHSCCDAVNPHPRNLSDDLMHAIAETGGVIQINASAAFLDPDYPTVDPHQAQAWLKQLDPTMRLDKPCETPLSLMSRHIMHALETVGPDHVGIGSDFDGVLHVPEGLEDCTRLPMLTADLLAQGVAESTMAKVLGTNVLRAMDECRQAGIAG
ncbi:MAG: dipeptidase [Phycisphaerae bacterium]